MAARQLRALNLNLLVALDALLTTRSVRTAAEKAGVTQSAMSHTLAQLRRDFADQLLVRRGNTMLLTPRAQALALPLRQALAGLDAVLREPDAFVAARSAITFTLAASDAVAITVVPALLAVCAAEAPRVDLNVVALDRARIEDQLASSEVDLAFGPPMIRATSGLDTRALYPTELVAILRDGHPALRRPLDLDTYCRLGHVVVSTGGSSPSPVDEVLARKRRTRRIAVRVPYFLAAPALVATSDLVLTAPRQAAEHAARGLPLRLVTAPIPLPRSNVGMFWHPRFSDAPPQRWLRDAVARALRSLRHEHAPA